MKKALLIFSVLLLAAFVAFAGLLFSRKSLTIEKGYEVKGFEKESLIYNIWSYGNWRERWEGNLHVSTFEPPYVLVLAISDTNNKIKSVQITEAKLCSNGVCQQIGDTLESKNEKVIKRDGAAIEIPYAAFQFKDVIPKAETYDLLIFFLDNLEKKHETTIKLVPFEKKKKGIYIWEVLMGV